MVFYLNELLDLNYDDCIPERGVKPSKCEVSWYDTKLYKVVRLQFLECRLTPFITITPRSTLTQSGNTNEGLINE